MSLVYKVCQYIGKLPTCLPAYLRYNINSFSLLLGNTLGTFLPLPFRLPQGSAAQGSERARERERVKEEKQSPPDKISRQ